MTGGTHNPEDSRPRYRSYGDPSRNEFVKLSERVTALETESRIREKQYKTDLMSMEKRFTDHVDRLERTVNITLSRVEKSTDALNVSIQAINVVLAEMKVRSGIIGAISAGVTLFLIMGLEWVKHRLKQ